MVHLLLGLSLQEAALVILLADLDLLDDLAVDELVERHELPLNRILDSTLASSSLACRPLALLVQVLIQRRDDEEIACRFEANVMFRLDAAAEVLLEEGHCRKELSNQVKLLLFAQLGQLVAVLVVGGAHHGDQHVENGDLREECGPDEVEGDQEVFEGHRCAHRGIIPRVAPMQYGLLEVPQQHLVLEQNGLHEEIEARVIVIRKYRVETVLHSIELDDRKA